MNKKTKIFIIILIIIIIIFIIIKLVVSSSPLVKSSVLLTPTPQPQNDADFLQKQVSDQKNNYPLINKTPYKTIDFEVYYSGPLELTVTMFNNNEIKIKSEVEAWLIENGVKVSFHQIIYIPLNPTPVPTEAE